MSSVERLKIQGIRSFGPDKNDEADIRFSSPLTLILGQNGCGKTTIIEALKYACCGELPAGTDQGSGFVHDPKLANLVEVKGNIKLRCRDVDGGIKTVSRAVRVVQKCKKLEFKSIDASVTSVKNGDKQETISGKCADIDTVMCQALGTSQAVLTNVIFCHQEDSLWPLEKGKKVKEKFDAIFGITEYNKCLDNFRAMSKDLDTKKTLQKKEVECSTQFWEDAKEKRKKLDEYKGTAEANRDCINQMKAQIDPVIDQLKEIIHKETNFAVHMAEIKSQRERQKMILEMTDDLKKEIREEFFGSKDALAEEIHTFEKKLEETLTKLEDLNSEKVDLQSEETRTQKEIDVKTMLMGQLQRDEAQHRDKIDLRNKRLRSLGNELEVNVVSSSQLNDLSSEDALRDIDNKIKKHSAELRTLQEEQKRFENQIQNEIDISREKKGTLTQDVKTKKKTIETNQREIEKVQAEIAEVDKSEDKLATLENNLKAINKQLDEAVASLNVDQCKAGIEQANDNIKKLEEKSSALEKEMKQLLQISVEKANLNKLIERQKNLEEEFSSLKQKHSGTLTHLLSSIPEVNLKTKLQTRINELNEEIRSHEKSVNDLDRKLSVLKEQKRSVDEQMKQKKKKMSQDQARIEDCCGERDIQNYYDDNTTKLQDANELKGTLTASKLLFKKYLDKLESEEHVCPLCHRDFSDSADYDEVLEDLRKRIDGLPKQISVAEIDIKKYTEAQKKAAVLLPLHEGVKKMKEVEIPKLKSDLDNIEKEIQNVESQLESHQNDLIGPQTDREVASKILPDIILLDQRYQEIQVLKCDVENLKSKLPSTVSERTLEQATEEYEKLKLELNNLRKNLSTDQRNLSLYNDRVNKLRERKTDLTAQQLKTIGGVQKRKTLIDKLEELNMMQTVLQKELEQAQAQLQPISEELDQKNGKLIEIRAQHDRRLDAKRKVISDFEKKVDEIKVLQSEISDYIKKGGSRRLENTKEELGQLKLRKDNLERRKVQLEKELEANKKFQNTHELQKRDLEANLKLRNKNEELAKVEEEIKKLEGHVTILNFDQLRREKEQLEKKKKELEYMKSNAEGKLQVVMSNIRDVEKELNQQRYKDAENEFRKNIVKLSVISKSIEDLKLYEKAMDWAMIHFHKERMKMINDIVRELWRHIYRGNDIDYIEIKTDEGSNTASGRRTYNYKVVQVKSGIEIDMPGRCSAGQKVLACLIIRMALAETFCKNCGILALDEPTTNLDRENIDSLSEALANIVERRSTQRNFQLLVITHDEEFLRKLFRVEKVEYYLEVKRNNKGRSEVIQRAAFL